VNGQVVQTVIGAAQLTGGTSCGICSQQVKALPSLQRGLRRDGYIGPRSDSRALHRAVRLSGLVASHPRETIMRMTHRLKCQVAILAVASIASFAAAQQPGGAYTSTLTRTTATVTAIDAARREVTIQGDHGPVSIQVSPDVKNFSNLKVGDRVNIAYYQGTAAQLVKGGKTVSDPAVSTFRTGTPAGMRPSGQIGASATVTVKIQDVNLPTNTVAFTKSDGTTHIVQVKSPEMQNFIRELKRGDVVQVTFTDSVAVEVLPAS